MTTNKNRFDLIGHLGADVEIDESGSTPRATFSLANNRAVQIDGEYQEITNWFRVVVFGRQAASLARLGKGSLVSVEGRLQPSTYKKDGVEVHTVNLIADRVEFLRFREAAAADDDIESAEAEGGEPAEAVAA
jgi:single-strand DNA-binding protein